MLAQSLSTWPACPWDCMGSFGVRNTRPGWVWGCMMRCARCKACGHQHLLTGIPKGEFSESGDVGVGDHSGSSSSPSPAFPDIRGNASCSVQASIGSKWEHGNGIWRAALDLVRALHLAASRVHPCLSREAARLLSVHPESLCSHREGASHSSHPRDLPPAYGAYVVVARPVV